MCQIKNRSTITPKLMGVGFAKKKKKSLWVWELCICCEYLLLHVRSQVQIPQDPELDLRSLKTTELHVTFEDRLATAQAHTRLT